MTNIAEKERELSAVASASWGVEATAPSGTPLIRHDGRQFAGSLSQYGVRGLCGSWIVYDVTSGEPVSDEALNFPDAVDEALHLEIRARTATMQPADLAHTLGLQLAEHIRPEWDFVLVVSRPEKPTCIGLVSTLTVQRMASTLREVAEATISDFSTPPVPHAKA